MNAELIQTVPVTSLTAIIRLVTDALPGSAHTRRAYRSQLTRFIAWTAARGLPCTKATVRAYLTDLADQGKGITTCNQALTAIKKLATEAADNRHLDAADANAIFRIKAQKQPGRRTGNWLTVEEAGRMLEQPDTTTLRGKRDRALLGLLLECGMRREEAVTINIPQIQQRNHRWIVADLDGKGNKLRTVPIPARCAHKICDWIQAIGSTTGRVLLPINKAGTISGTELSTRGAYRLVLQYAKAVGVTAAPHDLRRTFGRLAFEHGAPIEQIQRSYGHSDQKTTELYLGLQQDLDHAPCDFIDMEGAHRQE